MGHLRYHTRKIRLKLFVILSHKKEELVWIPLLITVKNIGLTLYCIIVRCHSAVNATMSTMSIYRLSGD